MSEARRRHFLVFAVGFAFVLLASTNPRLAHTQQASKQVVIGMLGSGSTASYVRSSGGLGNVLAEVLRENGFTVSMEYRFAEGKLERLPELAGDLVRLDPRLIVTADAVSTSAAKKASATIPIVMAGASDVLRLGLVQSLSLPGGNITGLSSPFGDTFTTKWVELLKEVLPEAKRFAVLWNPEIPAARLRYDQIQRAATALGLDLKSIEVRRAENFEQAFKVYQLSGASGLIVDNAPFISTHSSKIAEFAVRARVPTMSGHYIGGMLAYGIDYTDLYRRAGHYAVRILKGASPAELPIEQPSRFLLSVNLKVAKTLGVTVPPSVLLRADRVIE